jgi:hypothetical protein
MHRQRPTFLYGTEENRRDFGESAEMRADFVNETARVLEIGRRDLIEKDLTLHQILFALSSDSTFDTRIIS